MCNKTLLHSSKVTYLLLRPQELDAHYISLPIQNGLQAVCMEYTYVLHGKRLMPFSSAQVDLCREKER